MNLNVEHFSFSVCKKKYWLSCLEVTKCLSEWQTGKTLIRLLLQKQSDLGLRCLSKPYWQATGVRIFGTFTLTDVKPIAYCKFGNFCKGSQMPSFAK